MQVTFKYQTLPGIIWTVIPRAWEKKDIVLQLLMNFVGYKVSINTLVNIQGSHEKMIGGIIFSSSEKKICLKPLKLNVKFFLVAIWKKEKWLLYWPLDLKTLFNPTYSDTFTATSGLKTQGKIERGENGELYGDFQVKRGK